MDESARNRSSMTSAELEVVLGRIAAIEHEETLGPEDLLDFVEGKASRARTDAVHHALARSASLRTELFGFLEELGAFDIESLAALVTEAGARPGLSFERVNETPRASLGAGDAGWGMTRLPFRPNNWGWLLAAAAVLVIMVRPFGSEAPSPTDEAGAMTVVAATRAFDPGVTRGFSASDAVAVDLAHMSRGWIAIWVPESWAGLEESSLSVSASIDGGAGWTPMSVRLSVHEGDPAVLVRLERSRLRAGHLALRVRVEADESSVERDVVAGIRLVDGGEPGN